MNRAFHRPLHFLHIGKTGGTALIGALHPYLAGIGATFHTHEVTLRDIPVGETAIFFVRDPVRRYVSGFNSRLRKGLPRALVEWMPGEGEAFARFPTPGALASGLIADDLRVVEAARAAMRAIYHPARGLDFWLASSAYLAERRDDIAFVGATESLDADFALLLRLLGLPADLTLPRDPVAAHATPAGFAATLDDEQRVAIEDWYRQDAGIHAACMAMRREIIDGIG